MKREGSHGNSDLPFFLRIDHSIDRKVNFVNIHK